MGGNDSALAAHAGGPVVARNAAATEMNRTFSRARMILPLEAAAPWLQEVEERRLIAVVVNLRAVCQSLHDTLIRKADPNRRRDVEEKVGVDVPRGLEHPERIHPRLAWRSGVVE